MQDISFGTWIAEPNITTVHPKPLRLRITQHCLPQSHSANNMYVSVFVPYRPDYQNLDKKNSMSNFYWKSAIFEFLQGLNKILMYILKLWFLTLHNSKFKSENLEMKQYIQLHCIVKKQTRQDTSIGNCSTLGYIQCFFFFVFFT